MGLKDPSYRLNLRLHFSVFQTSTAVELLHQAPLPPRWLLLLMDTDTLKRDELEPSMTPANKEYLSHAGWQD